jgi:hypothetical protein
MIQQLFNPMNRRLPQFIKNGSFEKGGANLLLRILPLGARSAE